MKILKWLFGSRNPASNKPDASGYSVRFFRGKIYDVEQGYRELLERKVEIIATTITKDYTAYHYEDTFVLVVTYKPILKAK